MEIYMDETENFWEYVQKRAPNDELLIESLRQKKPTLEEDGAPSWKDKPLHGLIWRIAWRY